MPAIIGIDASWDARKEPTMTEFGTGSFDCAASRRAQDERCLPFGISAMHKLASS
jgi:hypothetical protein